MSDCSLLPFRFKGREWELGDVPKIMGILNVTPDSFSDGGAFDSPDRALQRALAMIKGGADIIDVGGESTRPGAAPVTPEEELARILPVIEALHREVPDIPISIDTRKATVAEAALTAGAGMVNDISGLRDPAMIDVVRRHQAGIILMHMRGTPADMQQFTDYRDLTGEICSSLQERLRACTGAGIDQRQIVIDPGIGFSKTAEQNLELIAATGLFRETLNRPILMGPSRKSFIGKILDQQNPEKRSWGTAAAVALTVYEGTDILRVHDVREMRDAALIAKAIRDRRHYKTERSA